MARAIACPIISITFLSIVRAKAADAPVIESVVDAASGIVLWQKSDRAAVPNLKPGQVVQFVYTEAVAAAIRPSAK